MDRVLWKGARHNPVKLLEEIPLQRLLAAAADISFLQEYDATVKTFDAHMSQNSSWFATHYGILDRQTIAYFSAEYAIHNSLPIYAGGLGALAGDYCKEASGTSGQKAALNGIPHFRVLDGWWHEGYNGVNGWAIGNGQASLVASQDDQDAEAFYRLLEEEIVPLYYERDWNGLPRGWIRVMKEAISSIVPAFCARRMVKEYVEKMYVKAAQVSNISVFSND